MISIVSELKKEHDWILDLMLKLESFANDRNELNYSVILNITSIFDKVWKNHEIKEEKFFRNFNLSGLHFPTEKMLLDEHRELRGHWKIVADSVVRRNMSKIRICLDTDGRMLIDKLRKHIVIENKFFDELVRRNSLLMNES